MRDDVLAPSLGLVLSGGAARGAYAAGVMRFVLGDLARRIGRPTWPDVVSGTSVGALNGVFAAARDNDGVKRLSELWRGMRIDDIYRLEAGRVALDLFATLRGRGFSLLNPAPFHALVAQRFPGAALREALDSGRTRAFIVAATEVATGLNALFVDGAGRIDMPDGQGARVVRTAIGGNHCRASAAIPFVFPPVAIDGRYHVDGGLRQNTPLRPVLAAGVQRAILVGVKQDRVDEAAFADAAARELKAPSPIFLAGKLLNALMLDPIERDLWSAEHQNRIVAWGAQRYGDGFTRDAEAVGLRSVDIVHLRPSLDLGELASKLYRERPPKASAPIRFMLDRVLDYTGDREADLLSYLYFDRDYTGALESLGYADARRAEDALARVLDA